MLVKPSGSDWKVHREGRALTHFASESNVAAVRFNDAFAYCQAETLPFRFRREERRKQLGPNVIRDSFTRVLHVNEDSIPSTCRSAFMMLCPNGESAPIWHSLNRVGDEVNEDPFE